MLLIMLSQWMHRFNWWDYWSTAMFVIVFSSTPFNVETFSTFKTFSSLRTFSGSTLSVCTFHTFRIINFFVNYFHSYGRMECGTSHAEWLLNMENVSSTSPYSRNCNSSYIILNQHVEERAFFQTRYLSKQTDLHILCYEPLSDRSAIQLPH